jgi:hypothetical protein
VTLLGPYLVACGLLVVAGVAKAVRPADTTRALGAALGRRAPAAGIVRGAAAAEAALGVAALVWPVPLLAALVGASYVTFAVVVAVVRRRGGALASCGCFGTPDTPATGLHVVIDLALAASAGSVAAAGHSGTLGPLLATQPLRGVPLVAVSALAGWLTFMALTLLPRLQAARRQLVPGAPAGAGSPGAR